MQGQGSHIRRNIIGRDSPLRRVLRRNHDEETMQRHMPRPGPRQISYEDKENFVDIESDISDTESSLGLVIDTIIGDDGYEYNVHIALARI